MGGLVLFAGVALFCISSDLPQQLSVAQLLLGSPLRPKAVSFPSVDIDKETEFLSMCPTRPFSPPEKALNIAGVGTMKEQLAAIGALDCGQESYRIARLPIMSAWEVTIFFKRGNAFFCRRSTLVNGSVANSAEHGISEAQWSHIRMLLKRVDFWSLASDSNDSRVYYDPTYITVEGRCGGVYHAITRREDPDTCLYQAVDELLQGMR